MVFNPVKAERGITYGKYYAVVEEKEALEVKLTEKEREAEALKDFIATVKEIKEKAISVSENLSVEKHKPVVKVNGNEVEICVGSTVHPMSEEHHIAWVVMETRKGYQVRYLCHTCEPYVKMTVEAGDELVDVYAYCNLHGVWKA